METLNGSPATSRRSCPQWQAASRVTIPQTVPIGSPSDAEPYSYREGSYSMSAFKSELRGIVHRRGRLTAPGGTRPNPG